MGQNERLDKQKSDLSSPQGPLSLKNQKSRTRSLVLCLVFLIPALIIAVFILLPHGCSKRVESIPAFNKVDGKNKPRPDSLLSTLVSHGDLSPVNSSPDSCLQKLSPQKSGCNGIHNAQRHVDTQYIQQPNSKNKNQEGLTLPKQGRDSLASLTNNQGKDNLEDDSSPEIWVDTLLLWAEPFAGRHFGPVKVTLRCQQKCEMEYFLAHSTKVPVNEQVLPTPSKNLSTGLSNSSFPETSRKFILYKSPIQIINSDTLFFRGKTPEGEYSPVQVLYYQIEAPNSRCQDKGGEPLGESLCMDRFEWPNRPNTPPQTYITLEQAIDSCNTVKKRLCTVEEWQRACFGPGTVRQQYPYGKQYKQGYCADKSAGLQPSGHFPACRSFEGLYDLTGNVWEWTGSPARERDGFYYAAGGSWDSGTQSQCQHKKYSFYPQNKYIFVGFRCCWEEESP